MKQELTPHTNYTLIGTRVKDGHIDGKFMAYSYYAGGRIGARFENGNDKMVEFPLNALELHGSDVLVDVKQFSGEGK